MRTSVKRALGLGVVGAAALAAWRAWNARAPQRDGGVDWTSAPFPFPPAPRPTPPAYRTAPEHAPEPAAPAWVEPNADGTCPAGYPVKAKLGSGIFHVPGGANYERTHPDRCYRDDDAAIADGLRASKV